MHNYKIEGLPMNTMIKATLTAVIIATSFTASAKDGAFTGNVQFDAPQNTATSACHYAVNGTADKSHSGIVITTANTKMTFAEKLLSAADK
ncbi:hypothetical protein [Photobacterium leiognathi]|uniref:hypothetical protein n=1 Tax=Photobacterium leiognathi TaxID=553611 RepID=UPI002981E7BD|nr:hypothetical protein [Photobacterium leiognathi]